MVVGALSTDSQVPALVVVVGGRGRVWRREKNFKEGGQGDGSADKALAT